MSKYNWDLLKRNKSERVIEVNEEDVFSMFDWYNHFLTIDPLAKKREADQVAVRRLENGPRVSKKCETWVTVPELNRIAMWYKYYPVKSEQDESVYKIVDQALNPKQETKN